MFDIPALDVRVFDSKGEPIDGKIASYVSNQCAQNDHCAKICVYTHAHVHISHNKRRPSTMRDMAIFDCNAAAMLRPQQRPTSPASLRVGKVEALETQMCGPCYDACYDGAESLTVDQDSRRAAAADSDGSLICSRSHVPPAARVPGVGRPCRQRERGAGEKAGNHRSEVHLSGVDDASKVIWR